MNLKSGMTLQSRKNPGARITLRQCHGMNQWTIEKYAMQEPNAKAKEKGIEAIWLWIGNSQIGIDPELAEKFWEVVE